MRERERAGMRRYVVYTVYRMLTTYTYTSGYVTIYKYLSVRLMHAHDLQRMAP